MKALLLACLVVTSVSTSFAEESYQDLDVITSEDFYYDEAIDLADSSSGVASSGAKALTSPVAPSTSGDQIAVRLNEQGIMKIMLLALKYNTSESNSRSFKIPANLYPMTIKKKDIASNPIITEVNKISNLNLNSDVKFYIHTSDIKINGSVDPNSLKATFLKTNPNGFDLNLALSIPGISVSGSSISLCEKRASSKKCGNGLKASLKNISFKTGSRPIQLSATLRLVNKNGIAKISVVDDSIKTNLEKTGAPTLNFGKLELPKVELIINEQATELDTSSLRDEIVKQKEFLGKKLLAFAADFITNDLAEMINVYLANTSVKTAYELFHKEQAPAKNDEFSFNSYYNNQYRPSSVDNTFVYRAPIIEPKKEFMVILTEEFGKIVKSAQVDLAIKNFKTPGNKDVQISGALNFILNNRRFIVQNVLGNQKKAIPALNLDAYRSSDLSLAISEPVINGVLDVVNSTGLIQELADTQAGVAGLKVNNIKVHLTPRNTIAAVANIAIDLKKLQCRDIITQIGDCASNQIAKWLEANNNNAVIYFPIEIEVPHTIVSKPDGSVFLNLTVKSPIVNDALVNTFKYPTNVNNMTNIVRKGVMKKLTKAMASFVNKTYPLDISKYLNQSGVVFKPKSIVFANGAYIVINVDLVDIKFNSKNPKLK